MFGVPGPACILCDNQSVIKNSAFPELVLKKKNYLVAYHMVREYIAAGKALIYFIRIRKLNLQICLPKC